MKKSRYISILLIALTFFITVIPLYTKAESLITGDAVDEAIEHDAALRDAAGFKEGIDIEDIVGTIINAFLGLLGTIFVVLMIYAGYLWMTAAGNEEEVTKAKKILGGAIVGLAIVLTAWAITRFVITGLGKATGIP